MRDSSKESLIMAHCPSCRLLVPHNASACTCGTSLALVQHPRQLASLALFAVGNLAAAYWLSRALFSLLLPR